MITLLWVVAISLTVSFLCSILEAVLLSVTHAYVELLKETGRSAGAILERFQKKIDEPIAAILTLNTIANTAGATVAGAIAQDVFDDRGFAIFSAALVFAILLYSEIIPKTLGATFWERLAPYAAHTIRIITIVLKPILIPLGLISRLLPGERLNKVSRAEIAVLANIGRKEGAIDEDEWEVMTNVIKLDEVQVGEVMTPRTDVVAVPIEATVEEAMHTMLDEGHLRIPVYRETIDQIEGILVARDLWQADREGKTSIEPIVREVQYVPPTKLVEDLLPEMRGQRQKMSVVVDEFGGTAGLVTLEDLIEEIVGEIQDEHEADEPLHFQPLGEGQIRIWGGVPVREVNDDLELELPEEPHDTLGGFVFGALNRLGRVGDVVEVAGGRFRVTRVNGRRIEYVVFVPDSPGPA